MTARRSTSGTYRDKRHDIGLHWGLAYGLAPSLWVENTGRKVEKTSEKVEKGGEYDHTHNVAQVEKGENRWRILFAVNSTSKMPI